MRAIRPCSPQPWVTSRARGISEIAKASGLTREAAGTLHPSPWEAPEAVLVAAGVRLEGTYPRPIVDHRFARGRFLAVAARHLKRAKH
jgi:hypothetical protein